MFNVSTLLFVVFGLMLLTNMFTQVLKAATWDKLPTNLLVVVISQVLTICSMLGYASIKEIHLSWVYFFGAVCVGIMVAFSAMFGFDKFKQAINDWLALKGGDKK